MILVVALYQSYSGLISCICRSWSQKIGFQNAIFKILVWNPKAKSFYIWYIIFGTGPLPKLFKLTYRQLFCQTIWNVWQKVGIYVHVLGQSDDWIFSVSLVFRTCNVWCYALSGICRSIRCHLSVLHSNYIRMILGWTSFSVMKRVTLIWIRRSRGAGSWW